MRLIGFGVAVLVVAVVVSAVVVLSGRGGEEPAASVAVVEGEVAEASEVETPTHTLTTTASGDGSITPGGTTTHDEDSEVTLTASWNDATHAFTGWGDDCDGTASTCALTMDADKTVTAKFAARCAHADDPTCIRAVYRGGPGDYPWVSEIPAWALIQSDQHGRYHVGRGWLVTVVTAASPPDGYSQFSLQLRPLEGSSPTLYEQLVSADGATYAFTVTPDEDSANLFTYDLTAAKPPARPGADPELGDVVATTQFLVPALRYNRLGVSGEATTPGSYAFLNTEGDEPLALNHFGQVPWRNGELRIHPTDASGTSRAAFYDAVQVGDSFDFRTYGLDCGFRFEVTSVAEMAIPRTFGIQRVGQFGQRCSQFIDQPGTPRDVHFVWGIRPAIKGSGRVLLFPYDAPAGPGTYRFEGGSPCVFNVPAGMRMTYAGTIIYEPAPDAPPDAPGGAVRLADVDTESQFWIDLKWCRETGRRVTSPEVAALFDHIAGSMRHVEATSTDLPGGRCGDPSDPACIWVVHRGTTADHPWVWEIPPSALIHPDAHGRYQVARGQTVTVRTLAYLPTGYTRFSLWTRPRGTFSPASAQRQIPGDARSYTFAVTADEDAPNLFTYDVTATRPGKTPEFGDVLVSTEFLVPSLRYNRLDATGAAGIPGSYIFLRRAGDAASAIGDFGYSAADATELRVHPTDASGASRATFYDTVQVGDVFDYRANDVDCGLRFAVTSVATTATPRTFGVRYVAHYGGRCDDFVDGPGVSRDAYFVWGVRPGVPRPRGEPGLLYGEPVGEGTYRVEQGLPCIVDVPVGDEIAYGGSYDLRPDADDPDTPTGGVLLLDAEMVSTLHLDTPTCREIARATNSSEADALFDRITRSARREYDRAAWFVTTTSRHNRLDVAGAAATPGSYAFLTVAGDPASAISDVRASGSQAVELRIHPTDASGTSHGDLYDIVQVGNTFDYRTNGLDCGLRFRVMSGGETGNPRTFGIEYARAYGEHCGEPVDDPGAARDVYFVWGVPRTYSAFDGVRPLRPRDFAVVGAYRFQEGAPCVIDVPLDGQVWVSAYEDSEPDPDDPNAPPVRRVRLHGVEDGTLDIDIDACREIARSATSAYDQAVFDQIMASIRRSE